MYRRAFSVLAILAASCCLCSCRAASPDLPGIVQGERWFSVVLRGERVGCMRESVSIVGTGGARAVALDFRTVMSFAHEGRNMEVVSESRSLYAADGKGKLLGHESFTRSGDSSSSIAVMRRESDCSVRIERSGAVEEKRADFRHTLSDALVGRRFPGKAAAGSVPSPCVVFLPDLPAEEDGSVWSEDEPSGGTRVVAVSKSLRRFALFDDSGELTAFGFGRGIRYERMPRAEACRPGIRGDLSRLSVFATLDRPFPFESEKAARMTVVVHGADPSDFPADGRQAVVALSGYSARITVGTTKPDPEAAKAPNELAEYLLSDSILPCDHPEIRELAQRFAAGETLFERARSVVNWVNANLLKTARTHLASALQVAREMRGDCTEHALLAAAMCRAAGVPARVSVGVACRGDGTSAFAFHAWIEAWCGEWVAMDPAWGQESADATHLKLADGANPYGLLPFLCEMKMELESAEALE